jgi:hypothetical protein
MTYNYRTKEFILFYFINFPDIHKQIVKGEAGSKYRQHMSIIYSTIEDGIG